MGKITEKNKEFAQEYLLTGNATRSYMKIYDNQNYKYCREKSKKINHTVMSGYFFMVLYRR